MNRRSRRALIRSLLALPVLISCGPRSVDRPPGPVIVIAIDGASWNAIRQLWNQGRLPAFRELARRGVTAEVEPVANASPVIWTSIATGVRPDRHGITDFVVPTASGDVPVSSAVRRVPAIWNMVSAVERRVAVLGWWASWPAESINGVVVTDRVLEDLERVVHPPDYERRLRALQEPPGASREAGPLAGIAGRDRLVARALDHLIREDFDLVLAYFRNVDAESHRYWKYFRPQAFDSVGADDIERWGERIPRAYEAIDGLLAKLLAEIGPEVTLVVLSDHGFHALRRGDYRYLLDLDRVLEHFGYLERNRDGADLQRSLAVTWGSPTYASTKLVRMARTDRDPSGGLDPERQPEVAARLKADLSSVQFENGSPAFHVRPPTTGESRRGADLTVMVRQKGRSPRLFAGGEPIESAVRGMWEISGTHSKATAGIFLATGPHIDPRSDPGIIHSLDVTPTLLYAMGLPVAEDFDGSARLELFKPEFRRRHPLRSVPTWGREHAGEAIATEADERLLEELRALGYLD